MRIFDLLKYKHIEKQYGRLRVQEIPIFNTCSAYFKINSKLGICLCFFFKLWTNEFCKKSTWWHHGDAQLTITVYVCLWIPRFTMIYRLAIHRNLHRNLNRLMLMADVWNELCWWQVQRRKIITNPNISSKLQCHQRPVLVTKRPKLQRLQYNQLV